MSQKTRINISIKQHILEFVKMGRQKNAEERTSGHQEVGRADKEVEPEAFLWCFMCYWEWTVTKSAGGKHVNAFAYECIILEL